MLCVNILTRNLHSVLVRFVNMFFQFENYIIQIKPLIISSPNLKILELEDGDIVCFQKSPKADSDTQVRYPDVPSFLEYVHNRQV
jgi:hypothetical protein